MVYGAGKAWFLSVITLNIVILPSPVWSCIYMVLYMVPPYIWSCIYMVLYIYTYGLVGLAATAMQRYAVEHDWLTQYIIQHRYALHDNVLCGVCVFSCNTMGTGRNQAADG